MKIKTFEEFIEGIQEALKTPLNITWIDKKDKKWIGKFKIEEIEYEIIFEDYGKTEKQVLCKVEANGNFDLLNDIRKAFSSIPTVEQAVIQFIKRENPMVFMFFALDKSKGRRKLYDRFCSDLAEMFNDYEYLKKKDPRGEFYLLRKKDHNKEELVQSIYQISKEYK